MQNTPVRQLYMVFHPNHSLLCKKKKKNLNTIAVNKRTKKYVVYSKAPHGLFMVPFVEGQTVIDAGSCLGEVGL